MTGVTSEEGTGTSFTEPDVTPLGLVGSLLFALWLSVQSFVNHSLSFFILFGLTMVYDLLRFTTSDYPHLVYSILSLIFHKSYNSLYWIK